MSKELLEQYRRLRKAYPGEAFSDGAYYALIEMENRFSFGKA